MANWGKSIVHYMRAGTQLSGQQVANYAAKAMDAFREHTEYNVIVAAPASVKGNSMEALLTQAAAEFNAENSGLRVLGIAQMDGKTVLGKYKTDTTFLFPDEKALSGCLERIPPHLCYLNQIAVIRPGRMTPGVEVTTYKASGFLRRGTMIPQKKEIVIPTGP